MSINKYANGLMCVVSCHDQGHTLTQIDGG